MPTIVFSRRISILKLELLKVINIEAFLAIVIPA
jgi:hypothetical protein